MIEPTKKEFEVIEYMLKGVKDPIYSLVYKMGYLHGRINEAEFLKVVTPEMAERMEFVAGEYLSKLNGG